MRRDTEGLTHPGGAEIEDHDAQQGRPGGRHGHPGAAAQAAGSTSAAAAGAAIVLHQGQTVPTHKA